MSAMIALQLAFWAPLTGALLIAFNGRHPAVRETLTLSTAILLFASLASLAPAVFDGAHPGLMMAEPLPGLSLQLTVEPLGLLSVPLRSFFYPPRQTWRLRESARLHWPACRPSA